MKRAVPVCALLAALLALAVVGSRTSTPLPARREVSSPPLADRAAPPTAAPVAEPAPAPDPIAPQAPDPAATPPSTTIVVLRWSAERVTLAHAADKPDLPWVASGGGAARFVIEDAESGARLGEGPCEQPRLCGCEAGRDHLRGDVMVRHEAVVRVKLPRLSARERVRLEVPGPEGWETLGSFLLERGS